MPAQQAVTERRDGEAKGPQEPGDQAADNRQRRADSRGVGTARTADKTRPDMPELDDDQKQDPDRARVMNGDDPGAPRRAGERGEGAGREQHRDQPREAPVGDAGGHPVSLGREITATPGSNRHASRSGPSGSRLPNSAHSLIATRSATRSSRRGAAPAGAGRRGEGRRRRRLREPDCFVPEAAVSCRTLDGA